MRLIPLKEIAPNQPYYQQEKLDQLEGKGSSLPSITLRMGRVFFERRACVQTLIDIALYLLI